METVPITPERKAQLEEYAQRFGKDTVAALDEVLAEYLGLELEHRSESVAAVMDAYGDVKAGQTQAADDFLEEVRVKHGFPR